ncbi:hypothetical protein LVD17_03350 [Fulvivirga ulvae]|uniref:hypothetical protein n=1 Tax=Fulvivirga ulvae TaxID=2904245 RepID=UPI001F356D02|nr:hypothetical protein [Fulvivirga ulvae]UII32867.1 hypothetical protein LVD17_03350 [Fulvivirga ulvae]
MVKKSIIIVLLTSLFYSCTGSNPNEQIDEGLIKEDIYRSHEIGWTIKIPEGWEIVSKDQMEIHDEKGKRALEQTMKDSISFSGLKHLISFRKNNFNIFQSSSEPFPLSYEGEWKDNNSALKELLYQTYINQSIKIDTSSSSEIVDGLNFEVFHIKVYGPEGGIILNQDMYSRYINGFDFGVSINYNNEKDQKEMMQAWKGSTFRKRPKSM